MAQDVGSILWGGVHLAAVAAALWMSTASVVVGVLLGPHAQARLDAALGVPSQARARNATLPSP